MKRIFISFAAIFFIAVLIFISSCEGVVNDFGGMFKLRDSLLDIYPDEDININVSNGHFISISFVNSDLKDLSKEKKTEIAEKVGSITKHFFNDDKNYEGWLTFAIYNNYIIFKYSESIDSYDLKLSDPNKEVLEDSSSIVTEFEI